MTIHIIPWIIHLAIFWGCYKTAWLVYRHLIYPNNRWQQRGNQTYSDARDFATFFGSLAFGLIALLYHGIVKIQL